MTTFEDKAFLKAYQRSGHKAHVAAVYSTARLFVESGGTRAEWLWIFDHLKSQQPKGKPKLPKEKTAKERQEAAEAKQKARELIAEGVFFTRIAGRYIGTVRVRELDNIASRSQFDMRVCAKLNTACKGKEPMSLVRECISPQLMHKIIKESE